MIEAMLETIAEAECTKANGGGASLPRDVGSALASFASASRKVEEYYQKLELQVRRLTEDLEAKNLELRRRVVETERMQAMLISTLQSLTCGVLAVGRDGIIVAANPAACEILDSPVQAIAGKPIDQVLPEIPEQERLIDALMVERAAPVRAEWTIEANGHGRRVVRISTVRAIAPYDVHLAGLILTEDVTELRRLERRAMVQSRLSGIGELTMNLAHEIRNPLGSISLFASTLAQELSGDESLGRLAEHLVAGVKSIEHVVSNALEFAQPRRLSMTRVDLAELLESTLVFIEHPRRQKSIEIQLRLPDPSLPILSRDASIMGDAEQLRQVFLNIALNALQAMETGGVLRVSLRPSGAHGWEVEITDDGVGIPKDDLEKIFDPFFTTKEKGSGIGLAVVHRILTAHGAQIEVESMVGAGTSFRVIFAPHPFTNEVE